MIRSLLTLAAVGAAATGLVLGAQELPAPAPVVAADAGVLSSPASLVPVSGQTVYCPAVAPSPGSRVSVGLSLAGDGRVSASALDGPAAVLAVADDLVVHDVGTVPEQSLAGQPLVVQVVGGGAGGLEVEQLDAPVGGGLTGHRCGTARTRLWFTGGSTKVGATTVLTLINPDPTPTLVDVSVLSRTGRASRDPGKGLLVAPTSQLTLSIGDLAPDRDLIAVEVVATRGRVAGAMTVSRRQGRISYGAEHAPASWGPANLQVLPGVPQGPGGRDLVLTNPGDQTAVAALTLTGTTGQQDPPGLAAVTVTPGTSVAVDLTPYAADGPLAVSVRSPGAALLATVLVDDEQQGRPERDLAYASAAPPLTAPGMLSDVVLRDGTEATLLLTAPEQSAQVLLTPVPVQGSATSLPGPMSVTVAARQTRAVRLGDLLPAGASGRFGLLVASRPGSGPVYAARYLRRSPEVGSTILPLLPAAAEVPSPAVRPDPLLGRP